MSAEQVEEFMGWLFRDGGLEPPRRDYDAVEQRVRLLINPPLEAHVPTPDELDTLLSDISACGYASEAREVVEDWTRKWWGVESAFTTKWNRELADELHGRDVAGLRVW